jgi:hypothetical protein
MAQLPVSRVAGKVAHSTHVDGYAVNRDLATCTTYCLVRPALYVYLLLMTASAVGNLRQYSWQKKCAALEEVGVKADKAEKVIRLLESKRGAVLNR